MSARDESYAAKATDTHRGDLERITDDAAPRRLLNITDVVAIIVGLVVGAGVFKAPSVVAANTANEWTFIATWIVGGAVSLAGALCYAELASAYPSTGGEYHFLTRAYGKRLAFLFAWSRLAILQTGSIALLAFVLGDYLASLMPFGAHGAALYAGLTVLALTLLNIAGLRTSATVQGAATLLTVLGLLLIIGVGLTYTGAAPMPQPQTASITPAFGLAMVFVLLTFGGWNESAYVSAELRDTRHGMARALIISIAIVTTLYTLVNVAFLNVLGLEGMRGSEVVAADAMRTVLGNTGSALVTAVIVMAILTSINVTILTGARTNYALARDFPLFSPLAGWDDDANAPVNALVAQAAITLLLVLIGTLSRSGFETMVHYVSPVFWLFFLLTTLSLFVLRLREPRHPRPFRVPLYPLTPLAFSAACAYMLYSSLAYTGFGALLGVAVLAAGAPLLFFVNGRSAHRR